MAQVQVLVYNVNVSMTSAHVHEVQVQVARGASDNVQVSVKRQAWPLRGTP